MRWVLVFFGVASDGTSFFDVYLVFFAATWSALAALRRMSGSWTWLNTNYTYNDLGEILTSTDPLNHRTSYDYTDNWASISNFLPL